MRFILKNRIQSKAYILLAAILYAFSFHYSYLSYVNPVFAYAHYGYNEHSIITELAAYLFFILPIFFYKASRMPAEYGASLLYVVCYAPAQLIILFNWNNAELELIEMQATLALSMAFLFYFSSIGGRNIKSIKINSILPKIIAVLTCISIFLIFILYGSNMRFVSFDEVYDLRASANQVDSGPLVGYIISWLSYVFLPYYLTRGILERKFLLILIGVLGGLIIYGATGAKAMLLMPVIILVMWLLIRNDTDFLLKFLFGISFFIFLITFFLPNDGLWSWVKSILLIRTIGTGGWTIFSYYEFFSKNPLTYFTHISPINYLFGGYPYGGLQLGQVIGLEYSGHIEANFNANFWASDAFAAVGLIGVPIVTIVMSLIFISINRHCSVFPRQFVVLWFSGYWFSMLNFPITTALLTGGGLLLILLLWIARLKFNIFQVRRYKVNLDKI
ncbi:hypothetical protein [Rheinheimera sp.]|uniref:hypothetical protein n=1 Tax=Rheinheimera sp. TaxID=1869214 RepID=UPI0040481CDC